MYGCSSLELEFCLKYFNITVTTPALIAYVILIIKQPQLLLPLPLPLLSRVLSNTTGSIQYSSKITIALANSAACDQGCDADFNVCPPRILMIKGIPSLMYMEHN